jgi:hypothetical protein
MDDVETFVKILCIVIIVWIFIHLINQYRKGRCSSVSLAPIKGISKQDARYKEKLRDYYIKTSYNSCSTGQFQNDWVNLCALENVIKQGCRCLDFEIYYVDGKTVVATSNSTRVTEKGTYNSLSIDSVIKTIAEKAVSNSMTTEHCPNPFDPLFLHFRIKSNHVDVYDDIATALVNHLDSKLLPNEYSYENKGNNLSSELLNSLLGKVIIMVDKIENNHIRSTKMEELVNIMGNSAFLRSLPYNEIVHTPDMDELIDYNKKNMTFGFPNLSYKDDNYNSNIVMEYGVQMPAMCFQNNNSHLQTYNMKFDKENGHAFYLKPERLRYVPVTVEEGTPIDPNLSYGYKEYKTNYYNFDL